MSIAVTSGAGAYWPAGGAGSGAKTDFAVHLDQAAERQSAPSPDALGAAIAPLAHALEQVDVEASDLRASAKLAQAAGAGVSPGDMIMLSMRCNEFLFHCELTANIANRTSDGVQQLFHEEG